MARCRYYKMCWLRLGYDHDEWNSDCRGGGDSGCKHFEPMPRKTRDVAKKPRKGDESGRESR